MARNYISKRMAGYGSIGPPNVLHKIYISHILINKINSIEFSQNESDIKLFFINVEYCL